MPGVGFGRAAIGHWVAVWRWWMPLLARGEVLRMGQSRDTARICQA